MSVLRALQRRVAKLETARKPQPSPIVIMSGLVDAFADAAYTGVIAGTLAGDFLHIFDQFREWDEGGMGAGICLVTVPAGSGIGVRGA